MIIGWYVIKTCASKIRINLFITKVRNFPDKEINFNGNK